MKFITILKQCPKGEESMLVIQRMNPVQASSDDGSQNSKTLYDVEDYQIVKRY